METARALGLPNEEVRGNNNRLDEGLIERNEDDNEFDIDEEEDGELVD